VAAAAPKALGAGIGTLLAGGDLGDAALNAVGFGAAGALGAGAGTAGAGAANAATAAAPAAAAPATAMTGVNTAASAAAAPAAAAPAMTPGQMMKTAGQVSSLMGGQPAAAPMPAAPQIQQRPASRMQDNPMLAQMPGPSSTAPASAPIPSTMPASMGLGTLPGMGQQMSSGAMTAGLGPNQQSAVSDYLRSQGMVGFV